MTTRLIDGERENPLNVGVELWELRETGSFLNTAIDTIAGRVIVHLKKGTHTNSSVLEFLRHLNAGLRGQQL